MQEVGSDIYTLESLDCVGTDSSIITNQECTIQIETLLATPYNVDGGDHIYGKVSAINVYGESAESIEGNGAYYTRVPDAPLDVQEDRTGKTSTTLDLVWTDGLNNGGIQLIDYRVKIR